jgi:REP-associated tyrosine transposase
MGRPLRNEQPGRIYHVTSRGSNGKAIYRDDFDRWIFTTLLGRFVVRQRLILIAWALMTNHFHLLLQNPFGGLSTAMQLLNSGYAWRFNQRHERTAHVFRNRFAASVIDSEAHLLGAARYIVLNPVRAHLCDSPAQWRWSSYRPCAGLDHAPPFLAESVVLSLFDRDPAKARQAYRDFVAQGHVPVSDTGRNASRNGRQS